MSTDVNLSGIMRRSWRMLLLGGALVSSNSMAANPYIFDNGSIDLNDPWGYVSDYYPLYSSHEESADNLLFSQDTTLTTIEWQGYFTNAPQSASTFHIRIWGENGGGLPDYLSSPVLDLSVSANPSGFDYQYNLSQAERVVLEANTTYWMSIVESGNASAEWAWGISPGGPNTITGMAYRYDPFDPFMADAITDSAFKLTGIPVPEPSTYLLLGSMLMVVAWRRRCAKVPALARRASKSR